MDKYSDRYQAGKILAGKLAHYAHRKDVLILALPRGGVPVAYEMAKALSLALDVFIVRKLGVPDQSELAMGAIAMGGAKVLNENIIQNYHISPQAIEKVLHKEQQELLRREMAYRGNHLPLAVAHKTIILVDDGIATGASMHVAIKALQKLHPAAIVLAVPVADKQICAEFQPLVYEVICPLQPDNLHAVGAWYHDFSQTEDDEVRRLLKQSKRLFSWPE